MKIDQLILQTIPLEDFGLKWRFTEEKYNVLPEHHLSEIKPLNTDANDSLGNLLFEETGLIGHYKLNEEKFNAIIELDLRTKTDQEAKQWLKDLNIDSNETVLLFWNSWGSAITNWNIFTMYYDDFFYPASDDLILTDKYLNWVLYFFHEEIVYYRQISK